jgi:hypothetical protein
VQAAGFLVESSPQAAAEIGVCTIGGVRVHLIGGSTPGVLSWTIETADCTKPEEIDVNGLKLLVKSLGSGGSPASAVTHPNGATSVHKAVILCGDTPDTISKLPIGAPVVQLTNHKKDGGDGNTFALWAMKGMSMFEIADLKRPDRGDGNEAGVVGEGPDTMGALFVIVDSLEEAGKAVGEEMLAKPYEYSGRMTQAIKTQKLGISTGVMLQGPPLASAKL